MRPTTLHGLLLMLAGAVLTPGMVSAGQTVHCKSRDYGYEYCRVRTERHVQLVKQLSKTRCRRGENWGYDRHGIWVDRGCDAEFVVGDSGDDRYDWDHRDHDRDHRDKHHDDKDAAVAAGAAIAGIALIAALSSDADHRKDDIASWAVGTFNGYDADENIDLQITVLPGGSVNGYADKHRFNGSLHGSRLETGRHSFTIERSGNGFLATDERNSRHRVMFRRSGSGY